MIYLGQVNMVIADTLSEALHSLHSDNNISDINV